MKRSLRDDVPSSKKVFYDEAAKAKDKLLPEMVGSSCMTLTAWARRAAGHGGRTRWASISWFEMERQQAHACSRELKGDKTIIRPEFQSCRRLNLSARTLETEATFC